MMSLSVSPSLPDTEDVIHSRPSVNTNILWMDTLVNESSRFISEMCIFISIKLSFAYYFVGKEMSRNRIQSELPPEGRANR